MRQTGSVPAFIHLAIGWNDGTCARCVCVCVPTEESDPVHDEMSLCRVRLWRTERYRRIHRCVDPAFRGFFFAFCCLNFVAKQDQEEGPALNLSARPQVHCLHSGFYAILFIDEWVFCYSVIYRSIVDISLFDVAVPLLFVRLIWGVHVFHGQNRMGCCCCLSFGSQHTSGYVTSGMEWNRKYFYRFCRLI